MTVQKKKSVPMNLDKVARGARPLVSREPVADASSTEQEGTEKSGKTRYKYQAKVNTQVETSQEPQLKDNKNSVKAEQKLPEEAKMPPSKPDEKPVKTVSSSAEAKVKSTPEKIATAPESSLEEKKDVNKSSDLSIQVKKSNQGKSNPPAEPAPKSEKQGLDLTTMLGGLENALEALERDNLQLGTTTNTGTKSWQTQGNASTDSSRRVTFNKSSTERSRKRKRKPTDTGVTRKKSGKRSKTRPRTSHEQRTKIGALDLFGTVEKVEPTPNKSSTSSSQSSSNKKSGAVEYCPTISLGPLPRSNNGVIFLVDGATAINCLSTFRKMKTLADCFVTKKVKQKKKGLSEYVNYHVHPSVGHKLTYFCARHTDRWKCPPAPKHNPKNRSGHKIFVISKDPRFSMLIKSLKADGVDVTLVDELSKIKGVIESELK